MAKFETFTDDFSSTNANWSYPDSAIIAGGQLSILPTPSYDSISSNSSYDLTSSYALVKVVQASAVGDSGTNETYAIYFTDGPNGNGFGWSKLSDSLRAVYRVDGGQTEVSSVTYDAAVHIWWRVSADAAGTVFWDTSADGSTWTPFGSLVSPTVPIVALQATIGAGNSGDGDAGTLIIDDFNLLPTAVESFGTATLSAATTVTAAGVQIASGAATLGATTTVIAAGVRVQPSAATLSATTSVTAAALAALGAGATLGVLTTVNADAVRVQLATVTSTATSSVTATGAHTAGASAALSATTTVASATMNTLPATALLRATTTVFVLTRTNWVPRPGTPVVVETVHAEAPALVGA
jgi:hypothetical protein